MKKITEADLKGKGNVGRPDIPGVSTAEMQRILDEIPREVIVPAFNELSDEAEKAISERYTKAETDAKINQRVVDIGTGDMTRAVYDPNSLGASVTVQVYTCAKTGTVYALTGNGAVGRCKIPAAWADGDTFTVNGEAVPAYCGADAVDGSCIVEGRWVLFTFDGEQLNFNGGGGLSGNKLAQATATEAQVLAGQKYYAGDKMLKTGTMRNNGSWPDADSVDISGGKLRMHKQDGYTEGGLGTDAAYLGNASANQVLSGVNASSANGLNFGGGMANNGAWNATISPGGYASIPKGYHNGNGVASAEKAGISLAAYVNDRITADLNYTVTISGANALLIIFIGSDSDKINTPTVSSGSVGDRTTMTLHLGDNNGHWNTYGYMYPVTGISGNCTVHCTTSSWDWGWGVWIYKIA